MAERIEFTRNYNDLSTNQGFQFEFICDRCGTGYRTRFQANTLGTVSTALGAASNLFGGILGQAANLSEQVRSAAWERAHDSAFTEAMEELRPDFLQCPRCSSWVCKKSCWNERKGLCKGCAPDVAVEMAAAQAAKTTEAVWTSAVASDEDQAQVSSQKAWKEGVRASCPNCNAAIDQGAKFCPECGTKMQVAAFCKECGAKLQPGVKFCPECGHKV
ncbi:MAG TPA: zinc ribbon domain-containing protein [Anaerolineales bacterium]|nr:zinc ribbon domain-containing protein [Anaerolineales bacterium]